MKHPLWVTLLLIGMFVASQLIGLSLVSMSISEVTQVNGTTVLGHTTTAIGDRPDFSGYQSFLYLLGGVLIGTVLLLVLIKFRRVNLWKFWFFFAVFLATYVALGVVFPFPQIAISFISLLGFPPIRVIALILALVLAVWKIYRPHPVVHNLSELLIYPGIAVLLVPIFKGATGVYWMLVVLLAISIYDAIAVWQTKHMVSMAKFQSQSAIFAGLMIPKKDDLPAPKTPSSQSASKTMKTVPVSSLKSATKSALKPIPQKSVPLPSAAGMSHAVLGGGDVAFPMLFAGVVMEGLIREGVTKSAALYETLIVVAFAAAALALLLFFAKKDRFYPAMPFLSAGCLLGWAVTLLL